MRERHVDGAHQPNAAGVRVKSHLGTRDVVGELRQPRPSSIGAVKREKGVASKRVARRRDEQGLDVLQLKHAFLVSLRRYAPRRGDGWYGHDAYPRTTRSYCEKLASLA